MVIAVLGVLVGALLGYWFPVAIPAGSTLYVIVLLCAMLRAGLFGVRAQVEGDFSARQFSLKLLADAVLGMSLCWLGIRLDMPVYIAPVTALTYMSHKEAGLIVSALTQNSQKKRQEKP